MLTREEVLKIAKLARLELSEEEVNHYQKQLGRVLEYVNELKEAPTEKEMFVRHVPADAKMFRDDVVAAFQNREGILKDAPELENDCFLLPTVVEFEE